jgi:hypothetical protein
VRRSSSAHRPGGFQRLELNLRASERGIDLGAGRLLLAKDLDLVRDRG